MQGKQEVMLRIIMTLLLATMGTDALAEGRALSPQVPNAQESVTPNDSTLLQCNAIYVGSTSGGSEMALTLTEGGTVTWKNVQAGSQYWVQVRKVLATGTTASELICLR